MKRLQQFAANAGWRGVIVYALILVVFCVILVKGSWTDALIELVIVAVAVGVTFLLREWMIDRSGLTLVVLAISQYAIVIGATAFEWATKFDKIDPPPWVEYVVIGVMAVFLAASFWFLSDARVAVEHTDDDD